MVERLGQLEVELAQRSLATRPIRPSRSRYCRFLRPRPVASRALVVHLHQRVPAEGDRGRRGAARHDGRAGGHVVEDVVVVEMDEPVELEAPLIFRVQSPAVRVDNSSRRRTGSPVSRRPTRPECSARCERAGSRRRSRPARRGSTWQRPTGSRAGARGAGRRSSAGGSHSTRPCAAFSFSRRNVSFVSPFSARLVSTGFDEASVVPLLLLPPLVCAAMVSAARRRDLRPARRCREPEVHGERVARRAVSRPAACRPSAAHVPGFGPHAALSASRNVAEVARDDDRRVPRRAGRRCSR